MANTYADRVEETSTTTGTGTYSLAGATSGYQTFVDGAGDATTVTYVAVMGTDWEVGVGTVTDASPDTLSRDTIRASTNGGAAVSWGAGTKTISLVSDAQFYTDAYVSGGTDVPVADGGTGGSTAGEAKTNLGFMTDVVDDTTPQLGGSLDVNGNQIVSVSNGNIDLAPDGSGLVDISLSNLLIDNNQDIIIRTFAGASTSVFKMTSSDNLNIGQENANHVAANVFGGTGDINFTPGGGGGVAVKVDTSKNVGIGTSPSGKLHVSADSATVMILNRGVDDGIIVDLAQGGTSEGDISVSGTTVSYNSFCGSHWSQLEDNSRPKILRGTVMETVDEMCEFPLDVWTEIKPEVRDLRPKKVKKRSLRFDVSVINGKAVRRKIETEDEVDDYDHFPLFTDDGKPVIRKGKPVMHSVRKMEEYVAQERQIIEHKVAYSGDLKPGETYTDENGFVHTISLKKNDQLPKSKISDQAESERVYGVFNSWMNGKVLVSGIGAYVIRVKGPVDGGDLLVSDGSGCAKRQAGNTVTSATIAKATSSSVLETYPDGSYLVPCTLMCG